MTKNNLIQQPKPIETLVKLGEVIDDSSTSSEQDKKDNEEVKEK